MPNQIGDEAADSTTVASKVPQVVPYGPGVVEATILVSDDLYWTVQMLRLLAMMSSAKLKVSLVEACTSNGDESLHGPLRSPELSALSRRAKYKTAPTGDRGFVQLLAGQARRAGKYSVPSG